MSTKKILHRMWISISVASSIVIAVTMSSDKMLQSPSNTTVKAPETELTPEAWNWIERNVIPRLTPDNYYDFLRRISESPYTDDLMRVKQAARNNWKD